MARITGVGGIFFKARDPAALSAWYRDMLGFALQDWGGVMLFNTDGPSFTVWNPFPEKTEYFAPSAAPFMINYAVDDLDGFLAGLAQKGIAPLKRADEGAMGQFAWIMDPEGNKIELWQPGKD